MTAPGADPPGLLSVLRLAVSDPGSVLPREQYGEDWDGHPKLEAIPHWSARAAAEAVRPFLAKPSPEQMLREFLDGAAPYHGGHPSDALWMKLIREEVNELADALADGDKVAIADACADILYNVTGVSVAHGIPLALVLAEVHRSNMTKLSPPVEVRADGKIVKGPGYEPPDLAPLLGVEASNA